MTPNETVSRFSRFSVHIVSSNEHTLGWYARIGMFWAVETIYSDSEWPYIDYRRELPRRDGARTARKDDNTRHTARTVSQAASE